MGNSNSLKYPKDDVSFGRVGPVTESTTQLLIQQLDDTLKDEIHEDAIEEGEEAKSINKDDLVKRVVNCGGDQAVAETLARLLTLPGNQVCADCTSQASTWASLSFCVFLCMDCVGCHRSLGSHVSFTQSVTLDITNWTMEQVEKMGLQTNEEINDVLEYHVPADYKKPAHGLTSSTKRLQYICAKYVDKSFSKDQWPEGTPRLPAQPQQVPDATRRKSFRKAREVYVGMVEITLLKGTNLAARDSLRNSSDPYVVFELGSRLATSSYKRNTLNPVWNEGPAKNLNFRIPWNGSDILKVSCWDHETVLLDSLIGRAMIDLRGGKLSASDKYSMEILLYDCKSPTDKSQLVPVRVFKQARKTLMKISQLTEKHGGQSSQPGMRQTGGRRNSSLGGQQTTNNSGDKSGAAMSSKELHVTGRLEVEIAFIDLS